MYKLKVAIVEDNSAQAALFRQYLERYQQENNIVVEVTAYTDGYAIVDGYAGGFDIILMDIEMGLMNGMEAAQQIRRIDEQVVILFITNMRQYAIQGYSVGALDYILKPVSYTAFAQKIRKAMRHIQNTQEAYIAILWRDGMVKLRVDCITRIESQGHRLTFYTQEEVHGTTKEAAYETTVYSMKELEEKLAGEGFMRCNSGCLVNLRRIDGIQGSTIQVGGKNLPLSRGRRAGILDALARIMI